jgi:photosystem II stability/assembly factor-like uncharacterized protein
MKKMLTMLTCLLIAVSAFGTWETVQAPVDYESVDAAVALDDNTFLKFIDNAVYKTTNMGGDWTEILLPEVVSVNEVDAVSATLAYLVADDGLIYKTEDAGDNWTQIGDTANFKLDMNILDAVDADKVFVGADDGLFLKTADGGTSWDTVTVCSEDLDGGIVFTSDLNGVVISDANVANYWRTTDGGASWDELTLNWPVGYMSKRLYDASGAYGTNTIALVGYHNVVFLSTDGGATFNPSSDMSYDFVRHTGVKVFDADNILVTNSASFILTTDDGAATWDTISPGTGQTSQALAYTSMSNGMLFSAYNQHFKTTDGTTYVPVNDWPGISFWGIAFPSESKVMLSGWGGGELSESNDGGATFTYPDNHASETVTNLYELHFLDENTGLMGGGSGLIKKTTDGGSTWVFKDNPMAQQSNKHINTMYVADNGDIYAGGSGGLVMRSTDNGENWELIDNEGTGIVYNFSILSNGLGIATMNRASYAVSKTADVDSLKIVETSYGYSLFRSVDERNGIIVIGGSDGIYRTTISEMLDTLYKVYDTPEGEDIYSVTYVNDSTLYAAGDDGMVIVSDDSGETWEIITPEVLVELEPTLQKIAYNGDKLFIVGQNGTIMSYDVDEGEVAVDPVPAEFKLAQNYPNPFNPVTSIAFDLPHSDMVSLDVYDITGRKVAELLKQPMTAGHYKVNFDASMLSSGVYFYRLAAGEFVSIKKMTLLK